MAISGNNVGNSISQDQKKEAAKKIAQKKADEAILNSERKRQKNQKDNFIKSDLSSIRREYFSQKRKAEKDYKDDPSKLVDEINKLDKQLERDTAKDALRSIQKMNSLKEGEEVGISSFGGSVVNKYIQAYLYGVLSENEIRNISNSGNVPRVIQKKLDNLSSAKEDAVNRGTVKRASQNPLHKYSKYLEEPENGLAGNIKETPNVMQKGTAYHMIMEKVPIINDNSLAKYRKVIESIPYIGNKKWKEFISDPANAKYKKLNEDEVYAFQPIAAIKDRVAKNMYIDQLFRSAKSFGRRANDGDGAQTRVASEESVAVVRKGKDGKIYLTTGSTDLITTSNSKGKNALGDYKTTSKDAKYVLEKPEYPMQLITYRHMNNIVGNNVDDLYLYAIPLGANSGNITSKFKIAYTFYKDVLRRPDVASIFKKYDISKFKEGEDLQKLLLPEDYSYYVIKSDKIISDKYQEYRELENNQKLSKDKKESLLEKKREELLNLVGYDGLTSLLGVKFIEVGNKIVEKDVSITEKYSSGNKNQDAKEYEKSFFKVYGNTIYEMIRLAKFINSNFASKKEKTLFSNLFKGMKDAMYNLSLHMNYIGKNGKTPYIYKSDFWGSNKNFVALLNSFESGDLEAAIKCFSSMQDREFINKEVTAVTYEGNTISKLHEVYKDPVKFVEKLKHDAETKNAGDVSRLINSIFSMTDYTKIDKKTGAPILTGTFNDLGDKKWADAVRDAAIKAGLYAPLFGENGIGLDKIITSAEKAVVDIKESGTNDFIQMLDKDNFNKIVNPDGTIKQEFANTVYGISINGHWISEYLHIWTDAYNELKRLSGEKQTESVSNRIGDLVIRQKNVLRFLFTVANIKMSSDIPSDISQGNMILNSIRNYVTDAYQNQNNKENLKKRSGILGLDKLDKSIRDLLFGKESIGLSAAADYWANPFYEQDKEIGYKRGDQIQKMVDNMTLGELIKYREEVDPTLDLEEAVKNMPHYRDVSDKIKNEFRNALQAVMVYSTFLGKAEEIYLELSRDGKKGKNYSLENIFSVLAKEYGENTILGSSTSIIFSKINSLIKSGFFSIENGKLLKGSNVSVPDFIYALINNINGRSFWDEIQIDMGKYLDIHDDSWKGLLSSELNKIFKTYAEGVRFTRNFSRMVNGKDSAFGSGDSDGNKYISLENAKLDYFNTKNSSGSDFDEITDENGDEVLSSSDITDAKLFNEGIFEKSERKNKIDQIEFLISSILSFNENGANVISFIENGIKNKQFKNKTLDYALVLVDFLKNANSEYIKTNLDKFTIDVYKFGSWLSNGFRKEEEKIKSAAINDIKGYINSSMEEIEDYDRLSVFDQFSYLSDEQTKSIKETLEKYLNAKKYFDENQGKLSASELNEYAEKVNTLYVTLYNKLSYFGITNAIKDLSIDKDGKLVYKGENLELDVRDTMSQLIPVVPSGNRSGNELTLQSEEKSYREFEFQYNYGGNYSNILKADLIQIKTNGGWVEIKMDNNGTLTTVGTNNTLTQSSNVVSKVNIVGNQEYKAGGSPVTYIVDDNGKIIATVYKEKNAKGKFDWGEGGLYGFMNSLKGMEKGEIEKAVMDKFNGPDKRYLNQDGMRNKRGDNLLNSIISYVLGNGSGGSMSSSGGSGGPGIINLDGGNVTINIANAENVNYGSGGQQFPEQVQAPDSVKEALGEEQRPKVVDDYLKEYESLLKQRNDFLRRQRIEESSTVKNAGLQAKNKAELDSTISQIAEFEKREGKYAILKNNENVIRKQDVELRKKYDELNKYASSELKAKEEEKEYAKQRAEYEKDINEVIKAEANIYRNEEKKKLSNSGVFRNAKEIAALDTMIEQDRARADAARARMAEKENGNFGFMFDGNNSRQRIESGLNYNKAKIDVANKGATSIYDQMANQINRRVQAVIDYGAAMRLVNSLPRTLQKIVGITKQLDSALTNIRVVTGYTREETQGLIKGYTELAGQLGMTTQQVTTSANEWLRQGYSIASVNELITATAQLSALGQIEMGQSVQYLTSLVKGFKLEVSQASDAVSVLTKLDQQYAVSAGGIAEALAQTASSARLAGLSLEEVASYVTVIGETTQQSMSSVGHAMRTIIARYGNVKAGNFASLMGDSEDTENLNDIEKVLGALGIQIRSTTMEFRPLSNVLDEVASKWETLTSVEQSAVSTAFGGVRQREQFLVLMNNWDEVRKAEESAMNSSGTAAKKYEAVMDSLQVSMNKLTAAWEKLTASLSKSEFLKTITTFGTWAVEALPTIVTILGSTFMATRGVGIVKGAASSTLSFLGIKQKDKKLDPQVSAIEDLKKTVEEGFKTTNDLQRNKQTETVPGENKTKTATSITWRDKYPKLAKGFGFVDSNGNKIPTGELAGKAALGGLTGGLTRALSLDWNVESDGKARNVAQTGLSTIGGIASAFGPWGMAIGAILNIGSSLLPMAFKTAQEKRKELVETAQKQLSSIQEVESKLDGIGEVATKAVEDRTSDDYKQLRSYYNEMTRLIAEDTTGSFKDSAPDISKFTGGTEDATTAVKEFSIALKEAEIAASETAQTEQRYNFERKIATATNDEDRKYLVSQLNALDEQVDEKRLELAYIGSLKYATSSDIAGYSMEGIINKLGRQAQANGMKIYGANGNMLSGQRNQISSYLRATGKFNNIFAGSNANYGMLSSNYAVNRRNDIAKLFDVDNFEDVIKIISNANKFNELNDDLKALEDEIYNLDPSGIQRIAHAFGLTVEEANKLKDSMSGLTSADAILGIDKIIERYKTFSDVLSDISDNSGITAENLNKVYTSYGYLTVGEGSAQDNILSNLAGIFSGTNKEIPLVATASTKRSLQTNTQFWTAIKQQIQNNPDKYLPKDEETGKYLIDVNDLMETGDWASAIQYIGKAAELQKLLNERTEEYVTQEMREIKEAAQSKIVEYREKMIDVEVSGLESVKNILASINDERKKELELLKAKEALENARKEKVGVYRAGVGFTYETNSQKVEEARSNLEKLEAQREQENLDYEINQLKNEKDILTAVQEAPKWENLKNFYDGMLAENGSLISLFTGEKFQKAIAEGVNKSNINVKAEETGAALNDLSEVSDEYEKAKELLGKGSISDQKHAAEAYNEALGNYQNALNGINVDETIANLGNESWVKQAGIVDSNGNADMGKAGDFIRILQSSKNIKEADYVGWDEASMKSNLSARIVDTANHSYDTDIGKGSQWFNVKDELNGGKITILSEVPLNETAREQLYSESKYTQLYLFDPNTKKFSSPISTDSFKNGKKPEGVDSKAWLESWWMDSRLQNAVVMNPYGKDYGFIMIDGDYYPFKLSGSSNDIEFGQSGARNLKRNANGALDFGGGKSLINEFGSEAIVTPGGTITSLPTHTGIVPADLTKNLFNLGAVAPNLVRELDTKKFEKGGSSLSEDNSTNINTLNATFKVDQTFDFEQFIRDAKQVASNNRYSY